MTIIFVHGRKQQAFEPDALHERWRRALRAGAALAGITDASASIDASSMPYYARTLVPPKEPDAPQPGPLGVTTRDRQTRSRRADARQEKRAFDVDPDVATFALDFARESAQIRPISLRGARTDAALSSRDRNDRSIAHGAARLAEWMAPWAQEAGIDWFLADVGVYLNDDEIGAAVDGVVRAALDAAKRPITLVGHSLGSVVAFRVAHSQGVPVIDHLVTLGSPLGVASVRDRLGVPAVWPDKVQRWTNAADPDDIVALRPALDRQFFFGRGGGRTDVENFADIRNAEDGHHGIEGYLGDPLVASRVLHCERGSR